MKVSTLTMPVKKRATSTVETIPIASITNKFDVRQALDDDRVLYLAELYENNVEVDPIKVIRIGVDKLGAPAYAFVDGRHRAAGRALLNLTSIEAIVVQNDDADLIDLLAESLKANYGGAKPPTRDDIRHTITRMLETGAKTARIREVLDFIPLSFLRKYIYDAQSRISKHRLVQALNAVSNGMKTTDAAIQFDVELDALRNAISGNKKKLKEGGARDYKSYVTSTLRSANRGIAGKITDLLRRVEDGEITVKIAEEVINDWEKHLSGSIHRIKDWRERLIVLAESLSGSDKD